MRGKRTLAAAAAMITLLSGGRIFPNAGGRKSHTRPSTESQLGDIAFSPTGRTLAWTFFDGKTSVLCLAQGHTVRSLPLDGLFYSLAFSPNGRTLAMGLATAGSPFRSAIRFYDLQTGRTMRTPTFPAVYFDSIVFSPQGHMLLSASMGVGSILSFRPRLSFRLWDPATGRLLDMLKRRCWAGSDPVAFSPDGRLMAIACYKKVYVLDARSRRQLWSGKACCFDAVTFSSAGAYLAAGGAGEIRLWDPRSGEEYPALKPDYPGSLAAQPNGPMLASGGLDGVIRLWNPDTGREIREWRAHRKWITHLAFSPDGKLLASTSSRDQLLKLWDTSSGKELWQWSANPRGPDGTPDAPRCEAPNPPGPW